MSDALQTSVDSSRVMNASYEGNFRVDESVLENFPTETKLLSASRFGTSEWTVTARLHLQYADGAEDQYFLKSATDRHGRTLMEGEFNAMCELYKSSRDLVPKPHSWGKYKFEEPETYFFVSQYVDMREEMPNPDDLCEKLAQLHRESHSPTNQFGFHITTCQGRIAQSVAWEDDWTVFFIKLLQHVIVLDFEANGTWDDLDKAEKRLISGVVPRLLDALKQDGHKVKPCLIHADLWEGNTGTSSSTGQVYIYDAAAFYAHNEMEVANWRGYYNKISDKVYTETYLKYYGPSEPKDEWDDRNRLYSIYYNVIYSVNHLSQGKAIRQLAYNDMLYLIDKYAPFAEDERPFQVEKSQMATLSSKRDHTL
ncbi:hypothetical protein K491DRAFT_667973 [Lophiostoma macrostomum CBS 122681]|uniref:protein-ribulosamine 3-kinase n=1 Tax=Lophiostoma macrostomum CBS 122681 TaxID=1314788 RepID=A0A6A6SSL5_9PLEO|nr:hypothetical protein K491DRAFT_667973 [Lophiostoma macrostomum CBS 122681]